MYPSPEAARRPAYRRPAYRRKRPQRSAGLPGLGWVRVSHSAVLDPGVTEAI